jgi:polysaccharide pyruvyl transferase WcaK-like protein
MVKCLLIGNYGAANFGDEALREYFLKAYPEVEWTVVSANPEPSKKEVSRLPGGVKSFFRFQWLRTITAFKRSDVIVFGGGTLFTDAESVYACFLWWLHAKAGRMFGKPLVFAFQGIGPFRTRMGEWFTRDALRGSRFISVRDPLSLDRVKTCGMSTKIIQSFDPIFSLFKSQVREEKTQKVFIIIPRHNSDLLFRQIVSEEVKKQLFDRSVILSLQPNSIEEQQSIEEIQKDILAIPTTVVPIRTYVDLAQQMNMATQVVTQRYHGAIAALAMGVPVRIVPQKEGDKLASLIGVRGEEVEGLIEEGEKALREMLKKSCRS